MSGLSDLERLFKGAERLFGVPPHRIAAGHDAEILSEHPRLIGLGEALARLFEDSQRLILLPHALVGGPKVVQRNGLTEPAALKACTLQLWLPFEQPRLCRWIIRTAIQVGSQPTKLALRTIVGQEQRATGQQEAE
jgi:hypothetical protein